MRKCLLLVLGGLLLTTCGHKTDLRLPTAEDAAKDSPTAVVTRKPVNHGATSLPPVPHF